MYCFFFDCKRSDDRTSLIHLHPFLYVIVFFLVGQSQELEDYSSFFLFIYINILSILYKLLSCVPTSTAPVTI